MNVDTGELFKKNDAGDFLSADGKVIPKEKIESDPKFQKLVGDMETTIANHTFTRAANSKLRAQAKRKQWNRTKNKMAKKSRRGNR
jgi:hypothetical protein